MIQHLGENRFEVVQLAKARRSRPIEVPSPFAQPVVNRPDENLMIRLQWYLEDFLRYPFDPWLEEARAVEDALESWGKDAFEALFDAGSPRDWLTSAKQKGPVHLIVSSDAPDVLAWPWEALHDPEAGVVGHQFRMERKLNLYLGELPPGSAALPKDRINILLVTARPYKQDAQYRSISRHLVDLASEAGLPIHVEVLRPPTFDALNECLATKRNFFHILHFDGHGTSGIGKKRSQASQGCLIFEGADGRAARVGAVELSEVLSDFSVPMVVLNACQSAQPATGTDNPYASVAASLLRAGVRSVVAMAYSVYVKGVQAFVPVFYQELFRSGNVVEAARKGRREMFINSNRSSINPGVTLRDWLVPVVYQQEAFAFSFASAKAPTTGKRETILPEETRPDKQAHLLVGRDGFFLALERALQRKHPAILIHGVGGIGKTTLAKAFLDWLEDTDGLGRGCLWFSFDQIHSAGAVVNEIGRTVIGTNFGAGDMPTEIARLTSALKSNRVTLVWDNFESACGIPGTEVSGLLPEEDREVLRQFLHQLRGGKTKVIITSRSDEAWLGAQLCYPVQLGELQGEERWDYAAQILSGECIAVKRDDKELAELLELVGGHPLAMQVVLAQLKGKSARQLTETVKQSFAGLLKGGDAAQQRIFATLELGCKALPKELKPLLVALALHEKYVDAGLCEQMAAMALPGLMKGAFVCFLQCLVPAGLVTHRGQGVYELHPVLTSYLRANATPYFSTPEVGAWTRAFVEAMSNLADAYAPKELQEQRAVFALHAGNFYGARARAESSKMSLQCCSLTWVLGLFAQNCRRFVEAERLYLDLLSQRESNENLVGLTYYQLGRIAEERRDFAQAKQWYLKSLAMSERLKQEQFAASVYHQLGRLAEEQRDFSEATKWYLKALAIDEKEGNEKGAAITYHQLGIIAEEQHDFTEAKKWYGKALLIKEKQRNDSGAALTYHHLGRVAEKQCEFAEAKSWYRRSLAVKERQGDDYGAASTYHHLGSVAEAEGELAEATGWYLKSLALSEQLGEEHMASSTYHHLGRVAQEQQDLCEARKWYIKSIAIKEKLGNEHGAANTYHQLGKLAQEQQDFSEAETWYRKTIAIEEKHGNDQGAAETYHMLGCLCVRQKRYVESGKWLLKAILVFDRMKSSDLLESAANLLVLVYRLAGTEEQAQLRALFTEAGLGDFPAPDQALPVNT